MRSSTTDPTTSHGAACMVTQFADEIWRKINGASRFSVSNYGRVRRDEKIYRCAPGLLSIHAGQFGYLKVSLVADDGRYLTRLVHRLVAEAFIPNPERKPVVRHLDGSPSNTRVGNLAWGTHKENVHDSISHGTQVRGSRQHLSKLTEMDVRSIKIEFMGGAASITALAVKHGISETSMGDILSGRTWRHVEPVGDLAGIIQRERHGFMGGKKTSRYTGVSLDRASGKWIASIRLNGKRKHVGEFHLEDDAAAAVAAARNGEVRPTNEARKTESGRSERVWELV